MVTPRKSQFYVSPRIKLSAAIDKVHETIKLRVRDALRLLIELLADGELAAEADYTRATKGWEYDPEGDNAPGPYERRVVPRPLWSEGSIFSNRDMVYQRLPDGIDLYKNICLQLPDLERWLRDHANSYHGGPEPKAGTFPDRRKRARQSKKSDAIRRMISDLETRRVSREWFEKASGKQIEDRYKVRKTTGNEAAKFVRSRLDEICGTETSGK